jgi:hypothetical protein
MTTLAEFLLARIAEDETEATRLAEYACPVCGSNQVHGCPGLMGEARHYSDPRRVLAECEAKRRIVERASFIESFHDQSGSFTIADLEYDEHILPLLALPYADHPNFREEWRPSV